MPKRYVGTSLKTGKPYDFISCWGETLDEQRFGHRVNLDPTEWNRFVGDKFCEKDLLIVETTSEGKPRVDANGRSIVRKSASGVEYTVMEYPADVDDNSAPRQKLRGLPLKLAEDMPKGGQDTPNLVVPTAPKAPETPEAAVQNDGTKTPETAMTDAGSVSPM
jgi:hypothetical protein